ncbi:phage tail protein, partial [Nissabacter archeti]|uniref:phage tail protein n=1 Tax=Nissabacter archeti TaxID=1917880 RepID=UPI0015882192
DAVLANLGLTEHLIPVGVPLPWPGAVPPAGWLSCDGAAFDKAHFPQLAQAYPSGKLPDLRGEFIRGWDNGRGVDHGRAVLSWQGHEFLSHNHLAPTSDGSLVGSGIIAVPGQHSNNAYQGYDYIDSAPTSSTGGSETRPRNISFNYIVRAA